MKATRLLAAAMVSMAASMSAAATQVMLTANAPKMPKTVMPSRTAGSSRNGGQRSNRAHQRAALKRRNVQRNRLAHR